MTKKEIYDQVVRLTEKLAQTKVAQNIFSAAMEQDLEKTKLIINAFPIYYPELHEEIVSFGEKYNRIVGDLPEDQKKRTEIYDRGSFVMDGIAGTNIIGKINDSMKTGDPAKVYDVIDAFIKEYPGLIENIEDFQEKFSEYKSNCKSKDPEKVAIFGSKADEEKGIFVFDTNIIDAQSFYILCIYANISDIYFFANWDNDPNSADKFFDAMEEATNEDFAEFLACYNIVDWVVEDESLSIAEILIRALAAEFEDED